MSDLELYIYIGLALIYFITRALKQKKTPRPPGNYRNPTPMEQESSRESPRERPMTFEELLQEFTGNKEPAPTFTPAAAEELQEEEEVETIAEDSEIQTYEGYDDYKTSGYTSYEELYEKSQNLSTIDEQVSLEERMEKEFEEEYEPKTETFYRAGKYRQMLMRKESLRDALILKEILNPKYL